jgi:hypothetical protein
MTTHISKWKTSKEHEISLAITQKAVQHNPRTAKYYLIPWEGIAILTVENLAFLKYPKQLAEKNAPKNNKEQKRLVISEWQKRI